MLAFRAKDRNGVLMLVFVFCSFLWSLRAPLAYVCACVLFHSVWDALTDNYISTWDGPDSEGLNGNLSDQEVHVTLTISLFGLDLGNVLTL